MEDDDQLRDMLAQLLEGENYDVITSVNGEDATRILETNQVDLIITDIIMPEKDGMKLIMDLRKQYPSLRIIAISGGGRHIAPQNPLHIAKKLGAQYILTKPFELRELLGAVRDLV
ncbi:MAG: response regulator [Aliifodinibius sp.]|nr:response regulator [Fodinibius sp.]